MGFFLFHRSYFILTNLLKSVGKLICLKKKVVKLQPDGAIRVGNLKVYYNYEKKNQYTCSPLVSCSKLKAFPVPRRALLFL